MIGRTLPPGSSAASSTSHEIPSDCSSMTEYSPAMPAPSTPTCSGPVVELTGARAARRGGRAARREDGVFPMARQWRTCGDSRAFHCPRPTPRGPWKDSSPRPRGTGSGQRITDFSPSERSMLKWRSPSLRTWVDLGPDKG